MTKRNLLVFVVAMFALVFALQSASAFGAITSVEVNGLEALDSAGNPVGTIFANFAGDKLPVLVRFDATANAENVQIVAWISGERADTVESERFDVINGNTYTKLVYLDIPSDLDSNLNEPRKLEVVVENDEDGTADEASIDLSLQRESYQLEILNVDMQPTVKAGESVVFDVVLKNRGSHFSEDTFLKVRIPQLGLETTTYYGDLSPVDQGGSVADKEDAVEMRTYLKIPANVPVGLYNVEIVAESDDSFAKSDRKVLVEGAGEDTMVVTSASSKTFAVDEKSVYKLTLVNRGTSVRVYDVALDAPAGLNLELDDPVVIVPAGSSRTVEITASSKTRDTYTFTAKVQSDGGQVISDETFTANVIEDGSVIGGKTFGSNNTAVVLTVILAIVFAVLLIVLIVLLTRKPQKSEEFGESYY